VWGSGDDANDLFPLRFAIEVFGGSQYISVSTTVCIEILYANGI